jgi:hypothetical protein
VLETHGTVFHGKRTSGERRGQGRQPAAFSVAQGHATARELGFENAVFFFEVSDDMLLMPIDPAGGHGDKDWQYHGGSSG